MRAFTSAGKSPRAWPPPTPTAWYTATSSRQISSWNSPGSKVKILDFGLARWADGPANISQAGQLVGTPYFMSPEQGRGAAVDHRADLFSLGCVLYVMLSGKLPFDGDGVMAVLTALAVEDPAPLAELVPEALLCSSSWSTAYWRSRSRPGPPPPRPSWTCWDRSRTRGFRRPRPVSLAVHYWARARTRSLCCRRRA